jgi:hypothetical protein
MTAVQNSIRDCALTLGFPSHFDGCPLTGPSGSSQSDRRAGCEIAGLLVEKMQPAWRPDFRFLFALGTLLCYPWTVPNEFSEARLAAGLFYWW